MDGRSRMNIDPLIPTMLGRATPGALRPGRHLLPPSVKRLKELGESHEE